MKRGLLVVALLAAGAAFAHEGVKNPAVKARMDGMMALGAATKVLGNMAKGEAAYDAAAAEAAVQKIQDEADRIAALFEANEDDPKSEALPAIWDNYADFTAKAVALGEVADAVSVGSLGEVKAAMPQIGAACKACHKGYRE